MAKLTTITSDHGSYKLATLWITENGTATRLINNENLQKQGESISIADITEQHKKIVLSGEFGPEQTVGQDLTCEMLEYDLGTYIPRVFRPVIGELYPPRDQGTIIELSRQIRIIWEHLQDAFEFVHPDLSNMSAYGDRLRNIILLSAMEAEAQMKSILLASNKKRRNIVDYRALEPVLALSKYTATFHEAGKIGKIRPFENFLNSTPGWWSAYNAVKHDRETEMAKATLENAIHSFAAVCVLYKAQYGHPQGFVDHIANGLFSAIGVEREQEFNFHEHYATLDGAWIAGSF